MKPEWLQKKIRLTELAEMKKKLRGRGLHTVCEEARCPNISECFSRKTATVMIMGDICTRSCKFCAVATGKPLPLNADEPKQVALWCQDLGFKHLVITSVDRDELPDQGSAHFAETICEVKKVNPNTIVEVLTPDFRGDESCLQKIIVAGPTIFNHNLETIERLTPQVRSAAKYRRSLDVLKFVKTTAPNLLTKSGLMLGLGETTEEVIEAMRDLKKSGCDMITLGQYLQPTPKHLPVSRYVHPTEFDELKKSGEKIGFKAVFAGPYVRSSYMADGVFEGMMT